MDKAARKIGDALAKARNEAAEEGAIGAAALFELTQRPSGIFISDAKRYHWKQNAICPDKLIPFTA